MKSNSIRPRARAIAWVLTLFYFASYFTRINFAVMTVKICAELGVEKSALAVVITAMTVAYGVGQILNGLLGDKLRPQAMLTFGLALAIACNVGMFFAPTVPIMTLAWCINGFAHSMLWPPIVRLMSVFLTDDEYGYAAVRVSWGSSFATIALYLACPLLLELLTWRQIILVCAGVGLAILAAWLVLNPRLFTEPLAGKGRSGAAAATEHRPLPRYVFLALALVMLGIVLQGSLRDGVTNWMPSFLCESFGISEENAIFSTVILALFSVVSFYLFDLLHRKLLRNEVTCASVIFVGSAASSLLLVIANRFLSTPVISMLLMGVIVACMHGINLMLITVVPKRFVKTGKVSTVSGILNACTYVGASASTYGFAVLAERFGWGFTLLSWLLISAAGAAVCGVCAPIWKRFRHEYADAEEPVPAPKE